MLTVLGEIEIECVIVGSIVDSYYVVQTDNVLCFCQHTSGDSFLEAYTIDSVFSKYVSVSETYITS